MLPVYTSSSLGGGSIPSPSPPPGTGESGVGQYDGFVSNIHICDTLIDGPVPRELCAFSKLRELDLDGGHLTGPIPEWLVDCFQGLAELDLSYNRVSERGCSRGCLPRATRSATACRAASDNRPCAAAPFPAERHAAGCTGQGGEAAGDQAGVERQREHCSRAMSW